MGERHHHHHGGADHDHRHDHGHGHQAGVGAPVLDIGGDVGALVATMDNVAAGTELFLRPEADPSTTIHTGVWDRARSREAPLTAAVFLELTAGRYGVLDGAGTVVRTVEIAGGEVAEIDLRS
jgi:hypothetical protein